MNTSLSIRSIFFFITMAIAVPAMSASDKQPANTNENDKAVKDQPANKKTDTKKSVGKNKDSKNSNVRPAVRDTLERSPAF